MRHDPVRLREGQRVIAFHFSLLIWCPPFAILSAILGAPVNGLILLLGMPLVIASLLLLRLSKSPELCGNALCFLACTVFTIIAVRSNGVHSPVTPWYTCLPVFALLLSGTRSGAFWTTAAAGCVSLLVVGHRLELLPHSELSHFACEVLTYTGFLAFLSVVFLMVWLSQDFESREHESLREANQFLAVEATTDQVTGIANRRYFDRLAEQEWKRHDRTELPLSIVIFDVDYFKQFNDAIGHAAGDRCLHSIAQAVQNLLKRPGDFVARFGGEEFAAVLPNTGDRDAARIAEQIRLCVKGLRLPHPNSPLSPYVTVSVGSGTIVPVPGDCFREFLREVDRALYRAKAGGRDRSVHVAAAFADAALPA
jgi:diguanylate cyclase (GGDEF)-like protein